MTSPGPGEVQALRFAVAAGIGRDPPRDLAKLTDHREQSTADILGVGGITHQRRRGLKFSTRHGVGVEAAYMVVNEPDLVHALLDLVNEVSADVTSGLEFVHLRRFRDEPLV